MSDYSYLEITALVFIVIFVIRLIYSILLGIWTCFLAHLLGFGVKWRSGHNVWAVITGGTDGIGLQYAKQLAKKGYSLMIISRSEDKLNSVAKTIKEEITDCPQIKTLSVDFNSIDIYDKICEELNKLQDIDVLVNNVGTIYQISDYFLEIPKTFNDSYINVNMVSVTKMLEIVLPKMVEKKRGIIINISSSASDIPIAMLATYAATKAYVTFLSEALSVEYESKGVVIQTVLPNQVKTKISKNLRMPLIAVTAEDYVLAAIKTVGIETNTYGHWRHKLFAYLSEVMISIVGKRRFMKITLSELQNMRNEFYKQTIISDTQA